MVFQFNFDRQLKGKNDFIKIFETIKAISTKYIGILYSMTRLLVEKAFSGISFDA